MVRADADDSLVFEKHVQPVLKAHCFHCHGEETELSCGLDVCLVRLMKNGGDSRSAIVPGNPENSLLWQRVAADDIPQGPQKLSSDQKELIRRWIAQGVRTTRPEPDDVNDARFTPEELFH